SARSTTNHETIRKWVEKHKGHPAVVRTGGEGGVLRIDFDEPGGNDDTRLERIGWDEFFRIFDESGVAFLHSEGDSRFNKFVADETANSKPASGEHGSEKGARFRTPFAFTACSRVNLCL